MHELTTHVHMYILNNQKPFICNVMYSIYNVVPKALKRKIVGHKTGVNF